MTSEIVAEERAAVRALRLANDRRRHQEVRVGGQEDGGGFDHQQGGECARTPQVVDFSVGEEEPAGIDTKPLVGHGPPGTIFSGSRRPPVPSNV